LGYLIGIGKEPPVLDGMGSVNPNGITIDNTSGVLVKNFMVQNFSDDGIFLSGSNNNLIKGNKANDNVDNGIRLSGSSNDNDVFFNRAFGNGDGVLTFDINDEDANNFKGNKCDTSDPASICN